MSTAIFDAYDAYLALIKAALPAVDAVGAVYDGAAVGYPTDLDFIVVGAQSLTETGGLLSVDAGRQDWVAVRATTPPRDETFTIFAVMVSWTGETDLTDCRSRAKTNIAAIETALRGNVNLGGALPGPSWCGLSVVSMEQIADAQGDSLHVLLALDCRCRI